MSIINNSMKATLDKLLVIHKSGCTDAQFMEAGFGIIQTLLNNVHMAQSHMFAELIGSIQLAKHPTDINDKDAKDQQIDSYMTQFSNVNVNIQHCSNATNDVDMEPIEYPYLSNTNTWQNKIDVDVEQCCARIGNTSFVVDEMDPEFLDDYPADTYIDSNGCVYGRPCLQTIDVADFTEGQIFCNSHITGYTDIRKAPTAII